MPIKGEGKRKTTLEMFLEMFVKELPPAMGVEFVKFVKNCECRIDEKAKRCAGLEKSLEDILGVVERLQESERLLLEKLKIVREERDAMKEQILQTPPPPAMVDAATEPAEATPEPTQKTYAEVAVQAPATPRAKRREQKASEAVCVPKPQPKQHRGRDTTAGSSTQENSSAQARTCRRTSPGGEGGFEPTPTRAVVIHGAPTKYKPGQMRRWIQEDNPTDAPKIIGIRWLLQEHRRVGKLASSLVVYLDRSVIVNKGLRMGRRIFRTTNYDWDR